MVVTSLVNSGWMCFCKSLGSLEGQRHYVLYGSHYKRLSIELLLTYWGRDYTLHAYQGVVSRVDLLIIAVHICMQVPGWND